MSFPSCIKIPASGNSTTSESSNSIVPVKSSTSYNSLISIANKIFGHGRWSHSVTSQTIDFVEYVMGKYHIGCAAFVRVQLADGTFHEDMGYSNTESAAKGSAIYSARSSSIALALKKALLCFGGEVEESIDKMFPKTPKSKQENSKLREERNNEVTRQKATESWGKEANIAQSDSSVENTCEIKQAGKVLTKPLSTPKRDISPRPKEPGDALAAIVTDVEIIMADECQELSKATADHTNATHKDARSKAMIEEEIRLERKRKQKQKQEEYKKFMQEKQLKSNDKPNPKY